MLSSQLETIEKNANRICGKLKSMSNLQFGDKWGVSSQSPQKNTLITAVLRTFWYWSESLEMSIADFNVTLEEAFTIIYECIDKYPHFIDDEQNVLSRAIVSLTDNVSNVKMALIRQKAAYLNKVGRESALSSLDTVITYVENTFAEVAIAIQKAGIKKKIDDDYRARKFKSRNPVIVPQQASVTPPITRTPATSPVSSTPPPSVSAPVPPPAKNIPIVNSNISKNNDSDSDNGDMEVF